jgi:membrane protein implicated in regulation of membrane protease activity
MPDWGWWVLGALVLLGIEALTLDLLFASFALGAVVGAVAAAFNAPVLVQVLAAVATALASLFVLRPLALRALHTEHTETNIDALLGAPALVMERVDARTGRVKVGGEIWSARTRRPGTEFTAGTDLVVVAIEGATAVVDSPESGSESGPTGE